MTIKSKLTIAFLLATLLPTVVISYLTFYTSKRALEEITISSLNTLAEAKEGQIFLFIEHLKRNTIDHASDGFIRDALAVISHQDVKSVKFVRQLNQHLLENKLPLNKQLIFIDVLDKEGIVVSSSREKSIGLDKSKKQYFIKGLTRTYVSRIHAHKDIMIEIEVAQPIKTKTHPFEIIGVLVNHYKANSINKIFTGKQILELGAKTQSLGIGETGESYLVNKERLMITESLFINNASFRQTVDTYPVKKALEDNQEIRGIWLDYRGILVVGASMIIDIDDAKWILIVEIDAKEAFYRIESLKIHVVAVGMIFSVIVSLLAYIIAKSFSTPISRLKEQIDKISRGDFGNHVLDIKNNDEIGFLTNAFNNMSDNLLRSQTDLKAKNDELTELSIKDGLTKIFNHRYLVEFLDREFSRSHSYGLPMSCIIFDIDYFKSINDNYGHLSGDYVLREVARLLTICSRKTDVVGRYGGEEFLMILTNTHIDEAFYLAEKFLKLLEQQRFSHNGVTFNATISAGISSYCETHESSSQIIAEADEALYCAKRNGRNRVCMNKKRIQNGTFADSF